MNYEILNALWSELQNTHFLYVLFGSLLGLFLLKNQKYPRKRILLLYLGHCVFVLLSVLGHFSQFDGKLFFYLPAQLLGYAVLASLFSHFLFALILPKLGTQPPLIMQDLFFGALMLFICYISASAAGFNLSALIPTSAVLTAVLGLALQDTLGNFISGLTLQMDHSLKVGDWIRIDGVEGQVSEIRWRYLALETRNWETVILPNSLLMKNKVLVLGKRSNQPQQLRRWIYFQVDYRFSPYTVIDAVSKMLERDLGFITGIATEPAPNCIQMGHEMGYAKYAIRYWLTNLAADDPTDHEVRTRLYFALQRAGITLAQPIQTVFLKQHNEEHKAQEWETELERRMKALKPLELFHSLTEEELELLAPKLILAQFGRGEVLTHQGAEGHWLYIIQSGTVSVRVQNEQGQMREVNQLYAGDFFGEMSLLTGAKRTATIVAETDVLCYQLDKQTFQEIIQQRPDLAEYLADVLYHRRSEYKRVQNEMALANQSVPIESQASLMARISRFFGL
jgi:small-conductance mechanosensitive channel/acetolactate synthase small subunit